MPDKYFTVMEKKDKGRERKRLGKGEHTPDVRNLVQDSGDITYLFYVPKGLSEIPRKLKLYIN